MLSTSRSRHSCLARGLVAVALAGLAGCSTTHDLGRVGDPATMAQIETLASDHGTTVAVTPLSARRGPQPRYEVTAAAADGLMVSVGGAPPKLFGYDRVESLSRRDRLHGARNGAVVGGLSSFALGFLLGSAIRAVPACCETAPSPAKVGLEVGGVFALAGVAVGAGLGALAGYHDRYVLAPTETASAR